jgi:hypothetical protein
MSPLAVTSEDSGRRPCTPTDTNADTCDSLREQGISRQAPARTAKEMSSLKYNKKIIIRLLVKNTF